jgi:ATPase subunit of ABC transporter with duplicated ATPase domains
MDDEERKMYMIIINRYKDLIERSEAKTISDLKSLINPNDEIIKNKKEEIISKFQKYEYEKDFLKAAELAEEYITNLKNIQLPIEFWLTTKEIIDLGGGDKMDKSTFLCSLLIALGNQNSFVVVGKNKTLKIFVEYIFNGIYLFDPTTGVKIYAKDEGEMMKFFDDCKSVHKFNDRDFFILKGEE